ncbi:unnamed protein product, partial [Urochloa humidicola]
GRRQGRNQSTKPSPGSLLCELRVPHRRRPGPSQWASPSSQPPPRPPSPSWSSAAAAVVPASSAAAAVVPFSSAVAAAVDCKDAGFRRSSGVAHYSLLLPLLLLLVVPIPNYATHSSLGQITSLSLLVKFKGGLSSLNHSYLASQNSIVAQMI